MPQHECSNLVSLSITAVEDEKGYKIVQLYTCLECGHIFKSVFRAEA